MTSYHEKHWKYPHKDVCKKQKYLVDKLDMNRSKETRKEPSSDIKIIRIIKFEKRDIILLYKLSYIGLSS